MTSGNETSTLDILPTNDNVLDLFRSKHHFTETEDKDNMELLYGPMSDEPSEDRLQKFKQLREKINSLKNRKKSTTENDDSKSNVTQPNMSDSRSKSDSDSNESNHSEHSSVGDKGEYDDIEFQGPVDEEDDNRELEMAKEMHAFDPSVAFLKLSAAESAPKKTYDFNRDIPWMKDSKKYSSHPSLLLHQEIIDFVSLIEETQEEHLFRTSIIATIQNEARAIVPDAEFELYGSFPVGLMVPGSDIDIRMISPSVNRKHKIVKFLGALRNRLVKKNFDCQVVGHAVVPIIKIQHESTRHWFDMSVQMEDDQPLSRVIDYIRANLEKYPALRYLVLVVKIFLKQRHMNDAAVGGLSSYGIFLMVLSFLQQHSSHHDPEVARTTSLGILLIDFFGLYGLYFNYERVAIDVVGEGRYVRKETLLSQITRPRSFRTTGEGKHRLAIVDPLDKTNCVTFITYNMDRIRYAFKGAFGHLTSTFDASKNTSLLGRIIAVRESLKERALLLREIYVGDRTRTNQNKRKRRDNDKRQKKKKRRE